MVFRKKYGTIEGTEAKQWTPYREINIREVKTILRRFGRNPMPKEYYKGKTRVIYDETAQKEEPERCGKYNGTYLIALYEDTIFVRLKRKRIKFISKDDMMSFKNKVESELEQTIIFVGDKRFRRMRLSAKHFKIFRMIEHNRIHRIFSSIQIKHYNGRKYNRTLWRETAQTFNLEIKFL